MEVGVGAAPNFADANDNITSHEFTDNVTMWKSHMHIYFHDQPMPNPGFFHRGVHSFRSCSALFYVRQCFGRMLLIRRRRGSGDGSIGFQWLAPGSRPRLHAGTASPRRATPSKSEAGGNTDPGEWGGNPWTGSRSRSLPTERDTGPAHCRESFPGTRRYEVRSCSQ